MEKQICAVCKTNKTATGGCLCDVNYYRSKNEQVLISKRIYNKLIGNTPLNREDINELKSYEF